MFTRPTIAFPFLDQPYLGNPVHAAAMIRAMLYVVFSQAEVSPDGHLVISDPGSYDAMDRVSRALRGLAPEVQTVKGWHDDRMDCGLLRMIVADLDNHPFDSPKEAVDTWLLVICGKMFQFQTDTDAIDVALQTLGWRIATGMAS